MENETIQPKEAQENPKVTINNVEARQLIQFLQSHIERHTNPYSRAFELEVKPCQFGPGLNIKCLSTQEEQCIFDVEVA